MADRAEIDRAKDVDLAAIIGRVVKLHRRGRAQWGCCPFHAEKTPSFKVEDGRFYCFGCGVNGDSIEWVRRTESADFREALRRLGAGEHHDHPHLQQRRDDDGAESIRKMRQARAIWSSGAPIAGTKAETYLSARAIVEACNPSLRFISAFPYAPDVLLPAMVAAMLSSAREIVAVQVTMLHPKKDEKANVATPRRTYGVQGAGAVRLAAAGDKLGIAEGVETGLSAMALTGLPVWCCLGAARMHHVEIPSSVRELHIFADDDGPGREAADRTADTHPTKRRIIRLPPGGLADWNDFLQARAEGQLIDIPQVPA